MHAVCAIKRHNVISNVIASPHWDAGSHLYLFCSLYFSMFDFCVVYILKWEVTKCGYGQKRLELVLLIFDLNTNVAF